MSTEVTKEDWVEFLSDVGALFITALIIWLIWNYLAPTLHIPNLTYWQSFLLKILVGDLIPSNYERKIWTILRKAKKEEVK